MKIQHALLAAALAGIPLAGAHAQEGNMPKAGATILDNAGETVGTATISQGPAGVLVELEIDGLPEGWKAMHFHTTGTCDDHGEGFKASGGHINPDGKAHGFLNPDGPDAADLPNFHVHGDGTARVQVFNERASLNGDIGATILDDDGAALVIHESPDDHMAQPIGGAGSRIACGVIEEAM